MTTSIRTSKLVAAVVGLGLTASLLLGVSANVASAQSMTLAQLVNLLVTLQIIPADKAQAALNAVGNSSASTASSYTFSSDLTVGSTGADVTALQNALGVSPATGYFGVITKAAVQKYQAANGISATGFVGPITRAKLNASSSMTTTTTTTTTTKSPDLMKSVMALAPYFPQEAASLASTNLWHQAMYGSRANIENMKEAGRNTRNLNNTDTRLQAANIRANSQQEAQAYGLTGQVAEVAASRPPAH